MKIYQHTQPATTMLVIMSVILWIELVLGVMVFRPLLVAVPLFLLTGWLFRSLTIEIVEPELRWRFGSGFIRKQVRLDDIAEAKAIHTSFWNGWGIHYTRFGWLYNVSGFDAVAITLRNGKRFCLGTDEPEKLAGFLRGHH